MLATFVIVDGFDCDTYECLKYSSLAGPGTATLGNPSLLNGDKAEGCG